MIKKKDNSKTKLKKGKELKFENLTFPSYQKVKEKIFKKVGEMPGKPTDLSDGEWSEQALKVLEERYLRRDEEGNVFENPEEMCWRVAWETASAGAVWGNTKVEVMEKAHSFYQMMISRKFLPNSPTLMNAGTGNMLQYSACFVLPVEDSMEEIFDAIKYQALIHKSGGGTGFSFTRLRPNGSVVKTSRGIASGPVSFMRIFDAATNEVKQGGKRRGANMGILRVDHPDIKEFIHCKENGGITNFNISVAITDEFMEAYKNKKKYNLKDPKTGETVGWFDAREIFDEIAESAWKSGDPGVIFIDRLNNKTSSPVPSLGPIEATNPCGEQPLYPYDACNLGSIFLNQFVIQEDKPEIDWSGIKKTVIQAVEFLDNIIEVNPFPLEQITKTVRAIRRIGLGVGGWSDMLIKLKIPYNSQEALDLAGNVMKFIQDTAIQASIDLAKKRGAFPLFDQSVYKGTKPRRNSAVTTIAPTGSISIIAGSSSGIEPLFAIAYSHVVKDPHLDRKLTFFNQDFETEMKKMGVWNEDVKEKIAEEGVLGHINDIPQELKKVFVTSHEIEPVWHIKTQSAFQKYTDNAVSKTINMHSSAKVEEVKNAYLLAWETDCKGITIFRDGCKDLQVLNIGKKEEKTEDSKDFITPTINRPFKVNGATYKINTPVGTAFVTINHDETGDPLELFVNVGKAGSDVTAMAEALGRTISTSLRFKSTLSPRERAKEVAVQLAGIGGRRSVGFGPNKVLSLPDAVAMALSYHFGFRINGFGKPENVDVGSGTHYLNGKTHANGVVKTEKENSDLSEKIIASSSESDFPQSHEQKEMATIDICPSCGANAFVYEEGCSKCHVCGHSEC